MELLAENSVVSLWLLQYGSIALFSLLAVGIIAMPVPEETLMVFAGVLISQGRLALSTAPLAAFCGSVCGITVSYFLGKTAGHYLLQKFGPWFGCTPPRQQKAHEWFERFGTWALVVGYFIPGIRHMTGIVAGITELEYPRFALFAYCGAALWVATFMSVGYFFGDYWMVCIGYLANLVY